MATVLRRMIGAVPELSYLTAFAFFRGGKNGEGFRDWPRSQGPSEGFGSRLSGKTRGKGRVRVE